MFSKKLFLRHFRVSARWRSCQFESINFDLFPCKITIRWQTESALKFSTQNKFQRHAAEIYGAAISKYFYSSGKCEHGNLISTSRIWMRGERSGSRTDRSRSCMRSNRLNNNITHGRPQPSALEQTRGIWLTKSSSAHYARVNLNTTKCERDRGVEDKILLHVIHNIGRRIQQDCCMVCDGGSQWPRGAKSLQNSNAPRVATLLLFPLAKW